MSGTFLYLIAALNIVILVGIIRVFREMRHGATTTRNSRSQLNHRGLMNRFLGPLPARIDTPWKMYPIGFLFGLGFDTATEVALLVLAGAVVGGLPFYADLVAADPVRRRHEPVRHRRRLLHELRLRLGLRQPGPQGLLQPHHHRPVGLRRLLHRHHRDPRPDRPDAQPQRRVLGFLANFNINHAGFVIVGVFVVTWAVALAVWRFGHVEERWTKVGPALGGPAGSGPSRRRSAHLSQSSPGSFPDRSLVRSGNAPPGPQQAR